jgi:hypothetical protein
MALTEPADAGNENTVAFNLGELKKSQSFYFMLTNGGDSDIKDIAIKSNNSAFQVSPASISVLPTGPGMTAVPVVRVNIVHGPSLSGVGLEPILSPGPHSARITITGNATGSDTAIISIALNVDLTVDAKVMDIELVDNGTSLDLTKPWGSSMGALELGGLGSARLYCYPEGTLEIKNTGSVDIRATLTGQNTSTWGDVTAELNIARGATQVVQYPVGADSSILYIALDGSNTVTDYRRLQLGDDGRAYLAVQKGGCSIFTNPPSGEK